MKQQLFTRLHCLLFLMNIFLNFSRIQSGYSRKLSLYTQSAISLVSLTASQQSSFCQVDIMSMYFFFIILTNIFPDANDFQYIFKSKVNIRNQFCILRKYFKIPDEQFLFLFVTTKILHLFYTMCDTGLFTCLCFSP